ncbi:MAG TPA: VOC family protein [Dehalococcoidia bacterium]|nr:VOC family protein [Dehalococcoidia bacterium]
MAATAPAGVPTQLGHIALRVKDVDRAVAFYRDVLGLKVKNQGRGVAFLGIRADASHELALFPLTADASEPDPKRVGMYHMAWEMASFAELEALHQRLLASGARITGYADGQCNVMFLDPDGNELEAIWEPSEEVRARSREPGGTPLPRLPR